MESIQLLYQNLDFRQFKAPFFLLDQNVTKPAYLLIQSGVLLFLITAVRSGFSSQGGILTQLCFCFDLARLLAVAMMLMLSLQHWHQQVINVHPEGKLNILPSRHLNQNYKC